MTEERKTKIWAYLSKLLTYGLIIYIFYLLGHSIWLNWTLKREIDQIKKDIVQIEEKNQNFENLILYYQSDSFKELEAREKLGLKKEDETVVSVPVKKYDSTISSEEEKINLLSKKPVVKIANWRAWWSYFFE